MKVTVLGSGSGGNCTIVSTGETCVLIDLGFGPRSLARRLREANLAETQIDAILLTHGHLDHSSGVPSFVRNKRVPVYMSQGTRKEATRLQEIENWQSLVSGTSVHIKDLEIEPFPISHDALQPMGFRLSAGGKCGAVATDLGELNPTVKSKINDCDWLVLESNHDENLLRIGPYPWKLKQRVLSRLGHLSNRMIADFLSKDYDGRTAHLFLAHLSRQNNEPEIALESARKALGNRSRQGLFESCQVHLTYQGHPSEMISV